MIEFYFQNNYQQTTEQNERTKIGKYFMHSIKNNLLKFDWDSTACACYPAQMIELFA